MPESTFTPGPWHVDDGEGFESIGVVTGSEELVASVFNVDGEAEGFDPECRANAALVAAAPDLLQACRALYHAMLSYKFGNASAELSEEVAKVAQAAIAKAEGKEAVSVNA